MIYRLLSTIFLTIILNVCYAQNQVVGFDYGHIEKNKYLNSFFGFEMVLPDDWIIQTKEQVARIAQMGKDLVVGDDSKMKAIVKASEINTANLLMASQFEQGSAVEYNPSISVVAENIHYLPGIKTGKDYLFLARRILANSQLKYDFIDKDFNKENIGGSDFYLMNAEITYLGLNIKQLYYTTIRDGFSIIVIISYVNEEQKQNMLKTINSIKFKK